MAGPWQTAQIDTEIWKVDAAGWKRRLMHCSWVWGQGVKWAKGYRFLHWMDWYDAIQAVLWSRQDPKTACYLKRQCMCTTLSFSGLFSSVCLLTPLKGSVRKVCQGLDTYRKTNQSELPMLLFWKCSCGSFHLIPKGQISAVFILKMAS